MDDNALVEAYLAASSHQAHFLRNMLADAGIEARFVDELSTLGIRSGEVSGPCLCVRRRDRQRARQILEAWDAAQAAGRIADASGDRSEMPLQ
ncbi:MAG: hypothetical protein EXS05_20320 [Planctomycetaceae bacterium]|nr:hypothetical protein [Planctomycetaceae bacterium]